MHLVDARARPVLGVPVARSHSSMRSTVFPKARFFSGSSHGDHVCNVRHVSMYDSSRRASAACVHIGTLLTPSTDRAPISFLAPLLSIMNRPRRQHHCDFHRSKHCCRSPRSRRSVPLDVAHHLQLPQLYPCTCAAAHQPPSAFQR